MDLGDSIKSWGTIIVTSVVLIFVGAWMFAVWTRLGQAPSYDSKGSLVVDEYSRAKDILVLVFPLLTTAVGYWLGSQGTAKAEQRAKQAEDQKAAVLSVSKDDDVLKRARDSHPDAFK